MSNNVLKYQLFYKITKKFLAISIKILNTTIKNKDSLVYEDYLYTIKHAQNEIERIHTESFM